MTKEGFRVSMLACFVKGGGGGGGGRRGGGGVILLGAGIKFGGGGDDKMVFGTGRKAMKASCIGAAGMTSGFGPSYQECLLALPKVNFSPPSIVSCIKIQKLAFASRAENIKRSRLKAFSLLF